VNRHLKMAKVYAWVIARSRTWPVWLQLWLTRKFDYHMDEATVWWWTRDRVRGDFGGR